MSTPVARRRARASALLALGLAAGMTLGHPALAAPEAAPGEATPGEIASLEIARATLHWSQTPADPAAAQSDAALEAQSGRGETTNVGVALTEQSLSAVNTGNTINAVNLTSGAISLSDSALSGFSGIGNVMMNTGANNNLQSTMSVTVVITP
jgi:hypothetical protein